MTKIISWIIMAAVLCNFCVLNNVSIYFISSKYCFVFHKKCI